MTETPLKTEAPRWNNPFLGETQYSDCSGVFSNVSVARPFSLPLLPQQPILPVPMSAPITTYNSIPHIPSRLISSPAILPQSNQQRLIFQSLNQRSVNVPTESVQLSAMADNRTSAPERSIYVTAPSLPFKQISQSPPAMPQPLAYPPENSCTANQGYVTPSAILFNQTAQPFPATSAPFTSSSQPSPTPTPGYLSPSSPPFHPISQPPPPMSAPLTSSSQASATPNTGYLSSSALPFNQAAQPPRAMLQPLAYPPEASSRPTHGYVTPSAILFNQTAQAFPATSAPLSSSSLPSPTPTPGYLSPSSPPFHPISQPPPPMSAPLTSSSQPSPTPNTGYLSSSALPFNPMAQPPSTATDSAIPSSDASLQESTLSQIPQSPALTLIAPPRHSTVQTSPPRSPGSLARLQSATAPRPSTSDSSWSDSESTVLISESELQGISFSPPPKKSHHPSTLTEDDAESETATIVPSRSDAEQELDAVAKSGSSSSAERSAQGSDSAAGTRLTLADSALNRITDAELSELLSQKPEKPESARKKEVWVESLYAKFAARTKQPFKLSDAPNVAHLCAFVRFLALYARYALSGIKQVVIPALRHMISEHHPELDKPLAVEFACTVKELLRNPTVRKAGTGKPPLCTFDVAEIIRRTPDTISSKEMEASLFLFALHTGSRALTCEHILLADLQQLELDEESGLACLVINQRVTKGNPAWNHPVTVEGYIDKAHELDVIYHLNLHVKKSWNMDLISLVSMDESAPLRKEKLWPLNRDTMRERLKTRLIQTGFPTHTWAFHSLRSGFICSSLLVAGADPSRRTATLEHTAVVAGWKVYGRAQRQYIKTVAEKMIVCSRLLGLGIGLRENPQLEANPHVASGGFTRIPANSEQFHGFKFREPNFNISMFHHAIREIFNKPFLEGAGDPLSARAYANSCWTAVLVEMGRKLLEGEKSTYIQQRRRGRAELDRRLIDAKEDPEKLGKELLDLLPALKIDPKTPREKKHARSKPVTPSVPERQKIFGRTGKWSRQRKAWTTTEDRIIATYKREHPDGKFSEVLAELPGRTRADVTSHWKYMSRVHPEWETRLDRAPEPVAQNTPLREQDVPRKLQPPDTPQRPTGWDKPYRETQRGSVNTQTFPPAAARRTGWDKPANNKDSSDRRGREGDSTSPSCFSGFQPKHVRSPSRSRSPGRKRGHHHHHYRHHHHYDTYEYRYDSSDGDSYSGRRDKHKK